MSLTFISHDHNSQTCRVMCPACRGVHEFQQHRPGKVGEGAAWVPSVSSALEAAGWVLGKDARGWLCSATCAKPPPAPRPRVSHELRCANASCSANCWVDGSTPQEDAAQAAVQGWVDRAPIQRGVDRIEHVPMGRLFCRANCARDAYLRSGKAEGRDSLKDEFWLDGSGNPKHPALQAAEAGRVAADAMPSEVQLACRVCPSTINTPTGPRAAAFLEASGWSLVHGEAYCSRRCFAIGARAPEPPVVPCLVHPDVGQQRAAAASRAARGLPPIPPPGLIEPPAQAAPKARASKAAAR
jgi:hypothetical protein